MIFIPRKMQLSFSNTGCFFFFLRKANVAVMNFASEMGKLIREILLLVHKSQKRVLISGYPSLIKSHLKLNVNVQLNSHYF